MPVVAATVHALEEAAQALLDASVAALALTDAGAPGIAHLTYFLPVLDKQCDQVVVYCAGIGEEATNPLAPPPVTGKRATLGRVNLPSLQVLVARCVATGQTNCAGTYLPPTDEQLTADGVKVMQDGWALWVNLAQQIRDDEWRTRCGDTHFAGLAPLAGQGGLAGWVGSFHISLDGFVA
jgi:hypothetical protein